MRIEECNPFVRAAQIQPAVLEGSGARMAYDHRLFYILGGEGELILEGTTLPLAPDTVLFFRPGVGYHFRGRLRVVVLNFDLTRACAHRTVPVCPPPVAAFDPAECFDTALLDQPERPLIRPHCTHLREDVLALVRAFGERDPWADAITSAQLKKLLADLLCTGEPSKDSTEELVARVRRYIRLYAADIRDNGAVGQEFGYHPVYIATLFREKTGESLHHAILAERVRTAKQWLQRTDLSVEEIALGTGFSSRSHFCTVFKSFTGLSPRQYRTQQES